VAVTVAVVDAEIPVVVTPNVADVAPAGTVTVEGTPRDGLLLSSATSAPPVAAGCERVTDPDALLPATTGFGLTVNAVTRLTLATMTGKSTLRLALRPLPSVAVRLIS
jgi:hypothetical protein